MLYTGRFLVFFNRHTDAPRVWTIAAPGRAWEVNVVSVDIGVPLATKYDPDAPRGGHDGPPSAWFEGVGSVTVDAEGKATIRPIAESDYEPWERRRVPDRDWGGR